MNEVTLTRNSDGATQDAVDFYKVLNAINNGRLDFEQNIITVDDTQYQWDNAEFNFGGSSGVLTNMGTVTKDEINAAGALPSISVSLNPVPVDKYVVATFFNTTETFESPSGNTLSNSGFSIDRVTNPNDIGSYNFISEGVLIDITSERAIAFTTEFSGGVNSEDFTAGSTTLYFILASKPSFS